MNAHAQCALLYLLTANYGGWYRKIVSSLHSLHGNRGFPIKSMKQSFVDPWWTSQETHCSSDKVKQQAVGGNVYLVLSGGGWWASPQTANGHFYTIKTLVIIVVSVHRQRAFTTRWQGDSQREIQFLRQLSLTNEDLLLDVFVRVSTHISGREIQTYLKEQKKNQPELNTNEDRDKKMATKLPLQWQRGGLCTSLSGVKQHQDPTKRR